MSVVKNRTRWLLGLGAGVVVLAATGMREPSPAATVSPFHVTVVGFALVNMTLSSASTPPQLQIDFQETQLTVQAAMSLLRQATATVSAHLEKAGVAAAAISRQGPPNLNNQDGSWQVSETLQVNFRSMTQLGEIADKTEVTNNPAVQDIYVNGPSSTPKATNAAIAAGYARAVQNAKNTANLIASADQQRLGAVLSIDEGVSSPQCGALECSMGASGMNPPQPGPNQELVAVTITYETTR